MSRELSAEDVRGICDFVNEVGHLRRIDRAGWKLAGIEDVESVAEHSYRTALIGVLLAMLEGADPARTALMCLLHDLPETRIGDIASVGKKYIGIRENTDVAVDQLKSLPPDLADVLLGIALEYRERVSPEAKLAKDADRVECLAQATEYAAAGHSGARSWIQATVETVEAPAARRLATGMAHHDPTLWWRRFVERYRGRSSDVADA